MAGPNGQAGQPQEMPQVERAPVRMRVDVEGGVVGDGTWVRMRFITAQGENEFWMAAPAAQAFARVVMQSAGGIIVPGPGEAPEGLAG